MVINENFIDLNGGDISCQVDKSGEAMRTEAAGERSGGITNTISASTPSLYSHSWELPGLKCQLATIFLMS
jgi:hypothetical protein